MQIIYLAVVFLVIIVLLTFRHPLYQAILGGLIVTALLYRIPLVEIGRRTAMVITQCSSLSVLLSLYLITFLQRLLESRSQIKLTQRDLDEIFHNRRINTAGAPLFIGLLPSAAAMLLCSEIVKDATDGYLEPKEQAFVASWFRHIPESTLPTYTGVLLMLNLSGVPVSQFLIGMIVPVITLTVLGYLRYLRRLPQKSGNGTQQFLCKGCAAFISTFMVVAAASDLSGIRVAVFRGDFDQRYNRGYRFGNSAGVFRHPGRDAANGISDVHLPCNQPAFPYSCLPGGSNRLFSSELGRLGSKNIADVIAILHFNDRLLQCFADRLVSIFLRLFFTAAYVTILTAKAVANSLKKLGSGF